MDFKEYQTKAHHTANYKFEPHMKVAYRESIDENMNTTSLTILDIPSYPFIKAMAESSELAQPAIKSALRGDPQPIDEEMLEKEIGDLLWYCAEMATVLGASLESIARHNIEKLEDRANRDVIKGSGDNR